MDRLLILRLGSMGDVLHALPAVAALRRALPRATLGWAIEERWSELVAPRNPAEPRPPLVDRLHFINARAWRGALLSHETWREIVREMLAVRAAHYHLALDFQGLWKSAALAAWSGVPVRLGFDRPREWPAGVFYTHRVPAATAHVVEQNLELVRAIAPDAVLPSGCLLPRDAMAEAWCEAELARLGLSQFVMISPGAGWGAKVWPAESFARVAEALAADGLRTVLNAGPAEMAMVRSIEQAGRGAAVAIASSLPQLVALTRRARLFIGGDTGPMHLAAALHVPVIALFGPTDPQRNGPYGTRSIVLRSPESATSYSHRARHDAGLSSIPSEQVIAAARTLLESA